MNSQEIIYYRTSRGNYFKPLLGSQQVEWSVLILYILQQL